MISFNNIGNLLRLANQMFQYASLKGIARNRGFEFTIPPEDVFGQNDPLVKTSPLNIYNVFENISKNKIEIVRNPMLQERMHEFDEELFRSCPDNVDLFGYFQSPKYFEHVKDEIKNDFKFTCKWYRDWVMYDDYGEYSLSRSLKMIFGKAYSKNRI